VKPLTDREICLYRERLERGRNIAGLTSVNRWIATVDDLKRQLAEVEAKIERLSARGIERSCSTRSSGCGRAKAVARAEKAERERDALVEAARPNGLTGEIACEDASIDDRTYHARRRDALEAWRDARKGGGE
jgi:hypothetical protein